MTAQYKTLDGRILTFTGEEFVSNAQHPVKSPSYLDCYAKKAGSGAWSALLSSLYVGTSGTGVNQCGSGQAVNYEDHPGYDYRAAYGSDVYAVANGIVVSSSGGVCVLKGMTGSTCADWGAMGIDHENGIVSQYLHLSSLLVKAGDRVVAGQKIGLSGETGVPKAPHLHFETLKRRVGYANNDYQPDSFAYVDPYGFDASKGPTDYLANTTGKAGGIPSVCLWKSGCTNP